jgi:hypothetical protein
MALAPKQTGWAIHQPPGHLMTGCPQGIESGGRHWRSAKTSTFASASTRGATRRACMVLLRDSDAHRPLINYICFQKLMLVIHMCGLILFFSFFGIGNYRTAEQQQDQPVQLL